MNPEPAKTNTVPVHTEVITPTPPAPEVPTPEEPRHARYPASPSLYPLRRYFVYVIVGGLIISALIAVIAILVGNMTDLITKSVGTVASVIIHSLLALGFISTTTSKQANKGSVVVINTLFVITILSLITSMLSIWDIVTSGSLIMKQYLVYFTAAITSSILYGLFQSNEDDKATVISRNTAIGATLTSFGLLIPVIYQISSLPDMYYRLLAATNVVAGVSVVITIIFHWYYISKHPELKEQAARNSALGERPVLRAALIICGILFGIPFAIGILQAITRSL